MFNGKRIKDLESKVYELELRTHELAHKVHEQAKEIDNLFVLYQKLEEKSQKPKRNFKPKNGKEKANTSK